MGSTLFLKQRFGFGYELTLLRMPNADVSSDVITGALAFVCTYAHVNGILSRLLVFSLSSHIYPVDVFLCLTFTFCFSGVL